MTEGVVDGAAVTVRLGFSVDGVEENKHQTKISEKERVALNKHYIDLRIDRT